MIYKTVEGWLWRKLEQVEERWIFHDWRMVDRGEELGGLEEGGQSGRRLKDKRNGGKTGWGVGRWDQRRLREEAGLCRDQHEERSVSNKITMQQPDSNPYLRTWKQAFYPLYQLLNSVFTIQRAMKSLKTHPEKTSFVWNLASFNYIVR